MNREELIRKWLDSELNPDEQRQFEALEDRQDLERLSDAIGRLEIPEYDQDAGLSHVMQAIQDKKKSGSSKWQTYALRIAAVLVLGFAAYYYNTTLDTNIHTEIAQKTAIDVPDASEITLNAMSSISFNERKWNKAREIQLDGEAFFKVEKGSEFTVQTDDGLVTVLGTEFNVKQRDGIFEVICYEGSVSVEHQQKTEILKAGDGFLILDGKYIAKEKEIATSPAWMANKSYFKSLPFNYVLQEFERQFNVFIATEGINTDQLFTGTFDHNNLDLALKSITLPLNLKYSQAKDGTIKLSSE